MFQDASVLANLIDACMMGTKRKAIRGTRTRKLIKWPIVSSDAGQHSSQAKIIVSEPLLDPRRVLQTVTQ